MVFAGEIVKVDLNKPMEARSHPPKHLTMIRTMRWGKSEIPQPVPSLHTLGIVGVPIVVTAKQSLSSVGRERVWPVWTVDFKDRFWWAQDRNNHCSSGHCTCQDAGAKKRNHAGRTCNVEDQFVETDRKCWITAKDCQSQQLEMLMWAIVTMRCWDILRSPINSLSYIKQYPVYYAGPAKAGVGCLLLGADSDQEHVPTRLNAIDEYCIAHLCFIMFHHFTLTLAMWHCV